MATTEIDREGWLLAALELLRPQLGLNPNPPVRVGVGFPKVNGRRTWKTTDDKSKAMLLTGTPFQYVSGKLTHDGIPNIWIHPAVEDSTAVALYLYLAMVCGAEVDKSYWYNSTTYSPSLFLRTTKGNLVTTQGKWTPSLPSTPQISFPLPYHLDLVAQPIDNAQLSYSLELQNSADIGPIVAWAHDIDNAIGYKYNEIHSAVVLNSKPAAVQKAPLMKVSCSNCGWFAYSPRRKKTKMKDGSFKFNFELTGEAHAYVCPVDPGQASGGGGGGQKPAADPNVDEYDATPPPKGGGSGAQGDGGGNSDSDSGGSTGNSEREPDKGQQGSEPSEEDGSSSGGGESEGDGGSGGSDGDDGESGGEDSADRDDDGDASGSPGEVDDEGDGEADDDELTAADYAELAEQLANNFQPTDGQGKVTEDDGSDIKDSDDKSHGVGSDGGHSQLSAQEEDKEDLLKKAIASAIASLKNKHSRDCECISCRRS